MCGVTRKDKIRNEHIRGTTRVGQASKKTTERRLNWYGHVMRRDGEHILRRVLRADIPGKRKRGRSKTRWKDACQRDLKSTELRAGEGTDRAMWRRKIISYTGDPIHDGKSQRKRRRRRLCPSTFVCNVRIHSSVNFRSTINYVLLFKCTTPCSSRQNKYPDFVRFEMIAVCRWKKTLHSRYSS